MLGRLSAQGAQFVRDDQGQPQRFQVPGHSHARSVRCLGEGTRNLMLPVRQWLNRFEPLVFDHAIVSRLLVSNGAVIGALMYDESKDVWVEIRAASTVLAAGGLGQLYPLTSNAGTAYGAGYSLALRAGASLVGMEFVQFTPSAVAAPDEVRGISTGGAILAQPGARLYNRLGERFMSRYDASRMEASTRDIVARAIYREVMAGRGTSEGAVLLDVQQVPRRAVEAISARFVRRMREVGVDPMCTPVPVAPEVHFSMGGVEIGPDCSTSVEGLFACGEAAGGLHGANRLNSNALIEAAVFGWIAGSSAAGAIGRGSTSPRNARRWRKARNTHPPTIGDGDAKAAIECVRNTMMRAAGIERVESGLNDGIAILTSLARDLDSAYRRACGLLPSEVLRLRAMVDAGLAVVRSAQERQESRGAHFRADFPEESPELYMMRTIMRNGATIVERIGVSRPREVRL